MADRDSLAANHPPGRRLFFALWPEKDLCREISQVGRNLERDGGSHHHPHDFHMTLVFLGQVAQERLACIEGVADTLQASPFELRLDQIDFWPKPRILLLGCSKPPEPLLELVRGLQQGLSECGFPPEKRPYRPHVTLARKAPKIAPREVDAPLYWPVKEFVLAGSSLGESATRYQVLKRWSLGRSGS